jgi:hypothetical protein
MSYSIYQPSGKVPPSAFPLAAACIAASLPLAFLYAWLIVRLPGILNFLVCFAFAFAMASAVKRVCVVSMTRNPRWVGGFGLLLGLSGCYLQWASWFALQQYSGETFSMMLAGAVQMAMQPFAMLGQAGHLIDTSSSAFAKCSTVAMWLGELWMLLFFPHYMGKMRAEAVFDEAAGKWADYVELPNRFRLVDQAALLHLLSSSSESLSRVLVQEPDAQSRHFSRIRVYRSDGSDPLVSVVTVEIREKEGRERVIESWPGMYLRVPAAELHELLATPADSATPAAADPPELADAIDRLQGGDLQGAYEEALPFVGAAEERLYCDANRICAIVCSQSAQWPQALVYWQALFSKEATAHNALQVATTSVMTQDLEQAAEWIEKAHTINKSSRELPSSTIITNMLSALTAANQHAAALPYLEELKSFYTHLHVTDPTFLFGHRMPLFHVFLEKSGEIVDKALNAEEGRAWYAAMLPHLDERGKAELTSWLDEESASA